MKVLRGVIGKLTAGAVLGFWLSAVVGCGDRVEIKDAAGNSILVIDAAPDKALDDLGMTLKKIRVWKSTPNAESPGALGIVDQYLVQIWAQLDGEEQPRYYANETNAAFADDEGNLYLDGNEPGSVVYMATNDNNNGSNNTKHPVISYTVTGKDGFTASEFVVGEYRNESTSTATNTNGKAVQEHLTVDTMGDDAPWKGYVKRSALQIFTRNRLEENKNLATKRKLGCLVKSVSPEGAIAARTFTWGDVELGNHIVHSSGARSRDLDDPEDLTGDDDSLWIPWNELWYMTGLNVNTRTVRFFRARSAPFFGTRELPGVDSDDTSPKPSGLESLIRQCNTNAGTSANGSFQIIHLETPGAVALNLDNPSPNYCATLNANVTGGEVAVKSIPLTSEFATPNCAFNTGNVISGGIGDGTWNGVAHIAPVLDVTSSLTHVEQTEIEDVTF